MAYALLDDQLTDHPKFLAVGPVAGWLYVCGLTYCTRLLTDGFIPEAQVRRLADVPAEDVTALVTRLVDARLWEKTAGGYCVHDYLEHNPSAAEVRERRAKTAERQARWRGSHLERTIKEARNAVSHASTETVSGRVSNAVSHSAPSHPTLESSTPDGVAPAADAPVDPAPFAALQDAEPPVRAVPKPKREKPAGHAAVRLYRRATDINPKEGVRQQIEEAIDAEDEDALQRWQRVLQEWLSRGYSAKNVAGLLDWFADGIPQRKRPASAGSPAAPERGYVPNPGPPPVAWDEAKAAASDAERERTRQELVGSGVLSGRRAPPTVPGLNGATKPPPDPVAAEERLRDKERRLLANGVLTEDQIATARRARHPAQAAAGA